MSFVVQSYVADAGTWWWVRDVATSLLFNEELGSGLYIYNADASGLKIPVKPLSVLSHS